MIPLSVARDGDLRRVLCIGAHSDDIEIGCGGTLMQLVAAHPTLDVHWVVLSGSERRAAEARCAASRFLAAARNPRLTIKSFRDGFFPYIGAEIKSFFEELKSELSPDLIFTHHRNDFHQDHRLVAELTWNTFRDQAIFEYEIPKYDGDLVTPNVFVPLAESTRREKISFLMESFVSQRDKPWFTPETFNGLLRLRGIECASPTGFAEGFHVRKSTITWGRQSAEGDASLRQSGHQP